MKFIKLYALLCLGCFLLASSCKKDKETPESELAKLPPETQTGARTFGALVNGKAFIPSGSIFSRPYLQCNYIYLNGAYSFYLTGSKTSNDDGRGIRVLTTNLPIKEGQVLKLENFNESGKAGGEQLLVTQYGQTTSYQTTSTVTGELHIKKFDLVKQIVSGTFFFDAVNPAGDIVHVTNGRFDMHYTN